MDTSFFFTIFAAELNQNIMRKRFLTRLNIILGALSMSLAGCFTSQKAFASKNPPEPKKYGPPPEELLIEKYGIPPYLEEEPEEPVQEPDSVPGNNPPDAFIKEPEPLSTLYGPPYGWEEWERKENEAEIMPPPEEKKGRAAKKERRKEKKDKRSTKGKGSTK